MNIEQLYQLFLENGTVQTDTRKLKKGDLFFALSGPNFNGNDFASRAFELGASYSIVSEKRGTEDERLIVVDDVLDTLQKLANFHRRQLHIPVIAITGSNGKTTTKELVHAVLSSHFITYTTSGNLNNHIGIPLTLLSVKNDAQIAVIEMGANHQLEIASYCTYTEPTHGVITNCGKAHLEGFGGLEGVRKGKGELFDYLREKNGTAFIYNDYDYLVSMSQGIKEIITYGAANAHVTGKALPAETFLQVQITNEELPVIISTQLVGDYNLPNVLCAAAIGKYFGVPFTKIVDAIDNYAPGNSRSQMVEKNSNHIILDAYNANPSSMKVAIDNFAGIAGDHKVLMLGAMMELGEDSVYEHQQIIEQIKNYVWDKVILVGGDFANTTHAFTYFATSHEACQWVKQQHFKNTYILIKGSRSILMEKLADCL